MGSRHNSKIPDLVLGDLPVQMLNKVLGLELEEGKAILSRCAQRHAAKRHPADYPVLLPHIASIVANPLYVGNDLHNGGKIELVGRSVSPTQFALVAISIERDEHGHYHVTSFYPVSRTKIEGRRERGFLKVVP